MVHWLAHQHEMLETWVQSRQHTHFICHQVSVAGTCDPTLALGGMLYSLGLDRQYRWCWVSGWQHSGSRKAHLAGHGGGHTQSCYLKLTGKLMNILTHTIPVHYTATVDISTHFLNYK